MMPKQQFVELLATIQLSILNTNSTLVHNYLHDRRKIHQVQDLLRNVVLARRCNAPDRKTGKILIGGYEGIKIPSDLNQGFLDI